jgi:hypothetical protein
MTEPRPRLHLYTRPHQPATRFVDTLWFPAWEGPFGPGWQSKRLWTRYAPQQLVPTTCCRKRRWAKHCTVQVFYDQVPFYCRPGHGCRDE